MRLSGVWRAPVALRSSPAHCIRVVAVAILAAAAAGCSSDPGSNGRFALASGSAPSTATIAFESIDGPPPAVFKRLVSTLNDEAEARHVTVVSRSGPAAYRVRAYVSALVDRGKTTFGWVWDVYDADKRRALRITGQEPAAGRHRNAWMGADERVIRNMARGGMERMATFLSDAQRRAPVTPIGSLFKLASARDDSPEAAGIVRLWPNDWLFQTAAAEATAADVPLPPSRPTARRTTALASRP
jgi:hypothetical protein